MTGNGMLLIVIVKRLNANKFELTREKHNGNSRVTQLTGGAYLLPLGTCK
jgi:hypothetical protein